MATNPYTPLDEDRKKLVLAEAQNRANRFEISKEQALYNYAVENGIDNAGVDTLMGFAQGGTDAWLKQQRDAGTQASAPSGQQAALQGNSSANLGIGGGQPTYQPLAPDHRAAVLAEAQNRATASGKSAEQELYDYAHKGGINNAGIDTLMGFAKGGTDAWQASNKKPKGIVESALSSALPTPGATQWSVSPDMTVQSQLRSVMDTNNPLMQQARTQGLQIANERGLLNSSIAESGAMDSMYKMALPIAAADASMYARAASENASNATNITNSNTSAATSIANTAANNDTSRFNNAANNDTSRFNNAANNATTLAVNNSNNETSRANTAANNATTLATNAANNETSRANAKLQTDAAEALGIEESKYRKLAQGSSSAAQLMTNYQGQLSSLLKDQSFSDTEARQTAIDQLTNSTKAAIQMIGAMAGDSDIAAYMSQLFPAEEGKLAPASPVKW